MRIIGIMGKKNSGKDTVADFLCKHSPFVKVAMADPMKRICKQVYDFTDEQLWGESGKREEQDLRYPRLHSMVLKEGAMRCACCSASVEQAATTQCYLTVRYALQMLGSEWGRDCYVDTWVSLALQTALRLSMGGCYYDQKTGLRVVGTWVDGPEVKAKTDIVIPDVRFKNEVKAIQAAGGEVWRVQRPERREKGRRETDVASQHLSETEQDEVLSTELQGLIFNNNTLEDLEQKVLRFLNEGPSKFTPEPGSEFDRLLQSQQERVTLPGDS